MSSLKIFIVANGIPDYDSSTCVEGMSGGDRFFMGLAKEWSDQGHKVHIFTSNRGRDICMRQGVTDCIFHIPETPGSKTLGLTWEYLNRMVATSARCLTEMPDIIFSSSHYFYDTLPSAILKSRWKDTVWLTTVFHVIPPPFQRKGATFHRDLESFVSQRISLSLIKKKADVVITENSTTENVLNKRFGVPNRKIKLAISGLDYDQIEKALTTNKIYDASYLGRIHPIKGVFDLVSVWSMVCRVMKDAKLVMMGMGENEDVQKFRETILEKELEDNIILKGFVTESKKYPILKASRIFVFASREEGWPNVFTEAMACDLPVVTYYLPTYRDREESIIKVRLGDKEEFAKKVVETLLNENIRNDFVERGRKIAMEANWKVIAKRVLDWCMHARAQNV